jgi:hypothetical protein
MSYIRSTYLPRQARYQAQVNLYQQALAGFRSQAGLPVPRSPSSPLVPAPGYMAQAMSIAFWDETACSPPQEGWDLVLDGGSRLPFPAATAADPETAFSGAMQIRLVSAARGSGKSVLMHNFVQGLVQLPPCSCPMCQPGAQPSLSGAGYTSGGKLAAGAVQFQNPGGPGGCPKCRYSACRCQPAAWPRFSNKGMSGFDGRTLADLEAELEAGELPDVFGVLRGYRWWSMTAPDLSKSPAHADQDWERSPLRGMRDVWQDGENIARCLTGNQQYHPDSEIPHQDCSCGFWAYWTLQVHDVGHGQLPVCGVVEGYGATVIGERGFRAAKARIVALHLPFTIQPAGDSGSDPDPLGLGLPAPGRGNGSPASPYNPGGTAYSRSNPWFRHPKFTGRVHHVPGRDPDTGEYVDPAGLSHEPPPELDKPSAAERQSNRDRADAWLAVMGDRLATMYPSAKIFETRAAMEAEFPPDLSYVPDSSREQCPHCSQWYQRKQNHPASCASRRS